MSLYYDYNNNVTTIVKYNDVLFADDPKVTFVVNGAEGVRFAGFQNTHASCFENRSVEEMYEPKMSQSLEGRRDDVSLR